jgi:hypothetical protein
VAERGKKQFVVSAGGSGQPYDAIGDVIVQPDGTATYAARIGTRWRIVVGTSENCETNADIAEMVIGANGNVACTILEHGKAHVVWGGQSTAVVDEVWLDGFNAAATKLGYLMRSGKDVWRKVLRAE